MPEVPTLTDKLKKQYLELFDTLIVNSTRQALVDDLTNKILANKTRYEAVAKSIKCPWFFIGVIHNMESSLSFKKHLHNGDPLTARTKHVPANRPIKGKPPFSWEESADDALRLRGIHKWTNWTVEGMLFKLEEYNGWGYRMYHPHVFSPYLWSFSNHYARGKYVADGTWSETAVSQQCGSAVLLRRFLEVKLTDKEKGGLTVPAGVNLKSPAVSFSLTKVSQPALDLQLALNKFAGVYVKPDGIPGSRTSDALKMVTGHYLQGDPRASGK